MLRRLGLLGVPCLILLVAGCSQRTFVQSVPKTVVKSESAQRFSFLAAPSKQELFARQLLAAVDSGDTKALLRYSDPGERRVLNLTESRLQPMVDLYLKERRKVKSLGMVECVPSSGKGTICMETLRADDTDFQVEGMIYETAEGPHALISQILLRGAENIMWALTSGRQQVGPELAFHIRSFQAFKKELEPKGITGLVFLSWQDRTVRLETWDTVLRRMKAQQREPMYRGDGRPMKGF